MRKKHGLPEKKKEDNSFTVYDLVQVMCTCNPQMERLTIWGFTYEEIMHRWKIWKRFDIVERIFGGKEKEEEDTTPLVPRNDPAALLQLQEMLNMQGKTIPV